MSNRAAHGVYIVRLYKGVSWHYLVIDDRFPAHVDTPEFWFAACQDPAEIWVPLLEKAFAKMHGSYEALISGGSLVGCCRAWCASTCVLRRLH